MKVFTLLQPAVAMAMMTALKSSAATLYFPGPATNPVPPHFSAIGAGARHSLGVQTTGAILAWGDNSQGQTTVPTNLDAVIAFAAGDSHNLALKPDGTVAAWGDNSFGQSTVPSGLNAVVAIAAGGWHSLALRSAGGVVAWGDNRSGESYVPGDLFNAVAIAAGVSNNLAVKSDGTVEAWGDNTYGQSTVPAGLANVVKVAAGARHSLALKSDGTVVAWGDNSQGQTDVPAGLSGVVAIAAGGFHNLALQSNGTVVAWGANNAGQTSVPRDLLNTVAIAAGGDHNLALRSDGTAEAWGDNTYGESTVPTFSTADLDLEDTVNQAHDGDTILVAPGQYTLTNQVVITNAITLKGSMGATQTIFNVTIPDFGFWVSNSAAVLEGLTVQADSQPKDIFLVGGTVQNCNFTNSHIVMNGAVVTMVGGVLSNAFAVYGTIPFGTFGMYAVSCTAGGLISDSKILGGGANAVGGALFLDRSQVRNSTLAAIPAGTDEEGSDWALEAHASVVANCIVHGNGGAWYNNGSGAYLDNCLMDRCVVAGCTARGCSTNDGGGGVFETNSIIRNSLIVSNSVHANAPDCYGGLGGGVHMLGGALLNCTIAENSAPDGAGVYVQNGGTVTNCIIFENSSSGTNQWLSDGSGIFDHCCTFPDPGGEGNITQGPGFLDLTNGNFHLAITSPCLGAGIVQGWMSGATDLDGNPRTSNGNVDIGAYQTQFQDSAPAPRLRIFFAAGTNTVIIAWPAAATGYGLEQCPQPGASGWTAAQVSPVVVNGENQVNLSPAPGNMFYRLRHP